MTKKPRKRLSVIKNENAVLDVLASGPKDAYEIARLTNLSPAGVRKIARRLCRLIYATKTEDNRGQVRKNQYYLMKELYSNKNIYSDEIEGTVDELLKLKQQKSRTLKRGRGESKDELVDELEVLIVEKVELGRQTEKVEERISEIKKTLSS